MRNALNSISRESMPRVTDIQIVCGDCGGDSLFPSKTLLTSAGSCSRCAGGNYVLAAKISGALARHLLRKGEDSK